MLKGCVRLFVLVSLALTGAPAFAQTGSVDTVPVRPPIATDRALSAAITEWRDAALQPAPQPQRDSLWNGALVGMGLGALAGAFGGNAWLESSASAGFNVPLTFGVIGAGAGAGIGVWIDAMHDARPQSPRRTTRIGLAPAFGKTMRGAVGWVRF